MFDLTAVHMDTTIDVSTPKVVGSVRCGFTAEQHLTTRTHAGVATRQLRTIKDMMYKRIGESDDKDWSDHIGHVLLAYNHKMVHNVTKLSPYDACKPKNHDLVLYISTLKAKYYRMLYPDIHVGDRVKIYSLITIGRRRTTKGVTK